MRQETRLKEYGFALGVGEANKRVGNGIANQRVARPQEQQVRTKRATITKPHGGQRGVESRAVATTIPTGSRQRAHAAKLPASSLASVRQNTDAASASMRNFFATRALDRLVRASFVGVAAALLMVVPASAWALGPGSIDRSFGVNGVAVAPIGSATLNSVSAELNAVVAGPHGRLIAAGSANDAAGRRAFGLARFTADGRLDETFGASGTVLRQLGAGPQPDSSASSLVLLSDGGVVAAGSATRAGGDTALAVARFSETGRLVWSVVHQIGRAYVVRDRDGTASTELYSAGHVALRQTDGKLLVGGSAQTETSFHREMAVARINVNDGSLDTSFAGTGFVVEPTPRAGHCFCGPSIAQALTLSPSGLIVVGGAYNVRSGVGGQSHVPFLNAFTSTGARDTNFAAGPKGLSAIMGLAPGPDGSFLAMGLMGNVGTERPAFARYTSAGALDNGFAPPAGFRPAPGFETEGQLGSATGFAVQPDERPVGAVGDGRVVRALPDGSPDESFGRNGVAPTAIGSVSDIAIQPDGKIVVGGPPGPAFGDRRFALTRLLGGTATGRATIRSSAPIHGRSANISLGCGPRGASSCKGILMITSRFRRRGASRTSFGRRRFALPAGSRATVRVRLNRTALRQVRRANRRMTVRVHATNGRARATQRRVVLVRRP